MITAPILKDLPPPPPNKSGWPWTYHQLPKTMSGRSEWPRISIITPSYNQGKFLEATIRSVLLQGYPNLEYIIIDGGSTDDSIDIIKKYENYLSYWHSFKDRGQADAINQGLEKSSGEILGWINSDDVYVSGTFRRIAKAFQSHPESIVVHGNRILINEMDAVTGWVCLPPFNPQSLIYSVFSETTFWRRSAMNEVGLLNSNLQFAMDLEFFGRLYNYGKFHKLNNYLGYFRCHYENKTSRIPTLGRKEAFREWNHLFGSYKMLDEVKQKKNILYFLRRGTELIKHPLLIGFPYLSYRLSKLIF